MPNSSLNHYSPSLRGFLFQSQSQSCTSDCREGPLRAWTVFCSLVHNCTEEVEHGVYFYEATLELGRQPVHSPFCHFSSAAAHSQNTHLISNRWKLQVCSVRCTELELRWCGVWGLLWTWRLFILNVLRPLAGRQAKTQRWRVRHATLNSPSHCIKG